MQNVDNVEPVQVPVKFETPIPLRPRFIDRPFPVDALPGPYADMVSALAEATQVDVAMPAVSVLTVLAAAAAGCAEVEVRAGWREPLSLFTATIALPGERKSAVQAALTDPVISVEEELAASSAAVRREADTLKSVAMKVAERARNAASGAEGSAQDKAKAEAVSAALAADAIQVPPITRLIADDVTPEAAGSLMAEQQRLAIISAEGGIFDTIAGRYSSGIPNLDLFLKGHAGDRLRIDRKGRDPEYVKKPALTVGLMVQPAVIEAIGRNRTFRGRGLLARFLYAEPRSFIGSRNPEATPIPASVSTGYAEAVAELVKGLAGWCGDPVAIPLTPAAHKSVVEVLRATEAELTEGGVMGPIREWGSKYVGAVVRIAALLHLARHGALGVRRAIEEDEILAAVRIGTYFKVNALRVFTTMATDDITSNAIFVLERIARTGLDELSQRDIYQETRSRIKAVADLLPVIDHLIDHGFIQPLPEPETTSRGRRPSPRFAIHPNASHYSDCSQTHSEQSAQSGAYSTNGETA